MKDLPDVITSQKLIDFLRDSKITMDNIPDRRYAYALGRNQFIDTLLIAVYSGEFDADEEREEADRLK